MRITSPSRTVRLLLLLPAAMVLSACTGSDEDVRITFCKQLAIAQLDLPEDVVWGESSQQIKRPEYAIVTVRPERGGRTSCWFEYDAAEETAETHVDPLSAYATLPYQVSVNGKVLGPRETLDAVNAEQRRLGRAAVEQLRQTLQH